MTKGEIIKLEKGQLTGYCIDLGKAPLDRPPSKERISHVRIPEHEHRK